MSHEGRSSRLAGFYKLGVEARLAAIKGFADLTDDDVAALRGADPEALAVAERMIENVAGIFHLPVGIAANFRIDDHDVLVPMVIEEASVVAASSNAARLLRTGKGILTEATAPLMIGQIQLCDLPDVSAAVHALSEARDELLEMANNGEPRLVARGGGARRIELREFAETEFGPMLVVHLLVDVCDAMGANLVNGMAERLAGRCEELSGGKAFLRILSNLADKRLIHATGKVPLKLLDRPQMGFTSSEVADRVVRASVFAEVDPYRAATHNKGIMNGVDAFLLATGQDWRAVEAGAHAYAARDGHYTAMAQWRVQRDHLVGRISMPMQVGIVGGVTRVHPVVKVLLKIVGAKTAADIGRVAAAVGLAQNLAAILALATEGIQRGHMSLHARNIAASVGARDDQIDEVVAEMIRRRTINHDAAASIFARSPTESPTAVPLTLPELRDVRDRHWPAIEALLQDMIPRGGPDGSLSDIFWYQFGTGGKRLRAVIPLIVFEAFGGEARGAVPIAAAMELLHNFSLIQHDALDRVRARRGRDTAWVRFGVGPAISCGDAMVLAAIRCLGQLRARPDVRERVSSLTVERMMSVVRAQMDVMRLHGDEFNDEVIDTLQERTGGLFSLSVALSAVLAGADTSVVSTLEAIGSKLGLIFQIQDELLGIVGGFARVRRGASIADGVEGLLVHHCLAALPADRRADLQEVLWRPASETTDADVHRAITLLRQTGSLRFGAQLIEDHQRDVDAAAADLPQIGLRRLCAGITSIFLAPLVGRFDATVADSGEPVP